MSCGDPHETPCDEVLEKVYLYLDAETEAEDHEHIRIHLDECAPCLKSYDLQRTVKAILARSCAESAPEGLRERVRVQIQQIQVRYTES